MIRKGAGQERFFVADLVIPMGEKQAESGRVEG